MVGDVCNFGIGNGFDDDIVVGLVDVDFIDCIGMGG